MKLSILFFIFLISFCIIYNSKKPEKFKILDIKETNEFYIDFNKNNLIEKNELVKLKNIEVFKPIKTNQIEKLANELGITTQQYLKAGYIAHLWAKDNLKYKEVDVYGYKNCKNKNICNIEIKYNNQDLSKFFLENGMGYVKNKQESKNYFQFLNIKETKNIANKLSKAKFVYLNLKTNVIHKANCEYLKKIDEIEILQEKDIKSSMIYCKKCFEENKKLEILLSKIPKINNIYKKSIFKNFNYIDLYLINPLESTKPNPKCNNIFCKRIIKEINSSKQSIDIALYGFGEQKEILDALIKAKQRGVKIRAILDSQENKQNLYYPLNESIVKNFETVLDNSQSLMHNKFFIFDNKLVLTGSANISSTGSGGYNSNLGLFIDDKEIANLYKSEFDQMFNSYFSQHKTCNNEQTNSNIKVYFSPKDDIYKNAIQPNIKNAKKNIYISIFYLTYDSFIKDLIEAKKRGVNILIIIDATSANNFSKKIKTLRDNNIPTIIEDWGGKNHEKTIAIDGKILITGSSNFSKSGFYKNDENILVINNSEITTFWEKHFINLFNSIDKKFLIYIPRAESIESKNSCFDGIDNNFDNKIDSKDIGCQIKQ